jgi:hypothetical protein
MIDLGKRLIWRPGFLVVNDKTLRIKVRGVLSFGILVGHRRVHAQRAGVSADKSTHTQSMTIVEFRRRPRTCGACLIIAYISYCCAR